MPIGPVFYLLISCFINFGSSFPLNSQPKVVHKTGTSVNFIKQTIDSNDKVIYLTFDDGPLNGSSNCIDICLNEKVPATFFEVGLHESRSAFGKKINARLRQNKNQFTVCNHSFSHANNNYLYFYHHPDAALLDFLHAQQILETTNKVTRLPGNNSWNLQAYKRASNLVSPLATKLDSAGFNIIGWDIQWKFNKKGRPIDSPEKLAQNMDSLFFKNETVTKNHLVLLMHDHMFHHAADSSSLVTLIEILKKNRNYKFSVLTTYPGLKK